MAREIWQTFLAERERWILWLPVALGLGIGIYFALPSEPALYLGPIVIAVIAVFALAGRGQLSILLLALILGAVALGFTVAKLRTEQVAAPRLGEEARAYEISGRIAEILPEGGRVRLLLDRVAGPTLDASAVPQKLRIRVSAKHATALRVGDRIALRAVLRAPPKPAAPGAFDFSRQAFFQRLGGLGYGISEVRRVETADTIWRGWRLLMNDLRQRVSRRVTAALSGTRGAIADALITGQRGAIPSSELEAIRDSGLAHLLAISGLHLGLVAGFCFVAIRAGLALVEPLALRYPVKKWAAMASLAFGFGYLLLAGAPIPTLRAFLMLCLVMLAVLLDRNPFSLRLVAFAAFALLLTAPERLLSASFQLSFAAVAALIAAYEAIAENWSPGSKGSTGLAKQLGRYFLGIAFSSLIATLATAPFGLFHFNRLALFGLLANLIAVPLAALWIMPSAVIALLLMPFGLEGPPLIVMGWGIELLVATAREVSNWPGAVLRVPAMPIWGLLIAVFGGLWLIIWRLRWRFLGLPAILIGLTSPLAVAPPDALIDGNARLVAVMGENGRLWLSERRRSRFEAELWARRAAVSTDFGYWPANGEVAAGQLRCDAGGCIYRKGMESLAFVRDPAALLEDCGRAALIVSPVELAPEDCAIGARLISPRDLERHGAHAIWLTEDGPRVISVRDWQGKRPWSR